MDWDFFISDGKFKAKRLPVPRCKVKIKDVSDLTDLRTELRGSPSIKDAQRSYAFYCDWYEVEVEDFEDFLERNPRGVLDDLSGLAGDEALLAEMRDSYESPDDEEWISVSQDTYSRLNALELVKSKESVCEEDWIKLYDYEYTAAQLDSLSNEWNLDLKGKKADKVLGLVQAIQSKRVSLPQPHFVKPGPKFEEWYSELQRKYISEIATGLTSFDYPAAFQKAVWEEALIGLPSGSIKAEVQAERLDTVRADKAPPSAPVSPDADTWLEELPGNEEETKQGLSGAQILLGIVAGIFGIWVMWKLI